jgi:hypothetical protein
MVVDDLGTIYLDIQPPRHDIPMNVLEKQLIKQLLKE